MHGLTILTPVYNDWESLAVMLGDLDQALDRDALSAEVLVVDDGSTVPLRGELGNRRFTRISRVEVLHLRRNLGHQRAIAIGLAFIHGERPCEAVVVMDADGQDRPSDVPALVRAFQADEGRKIVFAERARRSESLLFKVCYHGYRAVHKVLTGVSVRVGNFSILPFAALGSLAAASELWNHYSAAVFKTKLPFTTIPTLRASRIAGDPRMNFFALVLHGMSALSVFGEVIGVRLLVATSFLLAAVAAGFVITLVGQARAGAPGPGLALFLLSILLILTVQLGAMATALIFGVLGGRANLTFLPIRDYRHFVRDVSKTFESSRIN
jgi:glycosyltransferase involved in cell wall biosynthesis